ncbi:UxaA family hydrolase [Saccharicrinis aurantiacus]|uniref:UxaA family hydrolase n=1 Tax=Saccharicrinis aurantiacus TaxID=1849719 RepID=UPI0008FF0A7A|nr:altronate dehydratase family protein [Saccharicrinis aurantiacus]
MSEILKIQSKDNVVVALKAMNSGDVIEVNNTKITIAETIPFGHKIATEAIAKGGLVSKYGAPIGGASKAIKQGEHVHSHNLSTLLSDNLTYVYEPLEFKAEAKKANATFMGYQRKLGKVGIRNEFWIVPTVGCVNGQAKQIIEMLKADMDTSFMDDLLVLNHQYGCSQLGGDHENTRKALAAAIKHPNAGGVLVMGLGCENNQISALKEAMGEFDEDRVKFLVAQEVEDEVEAGFELAKELCLNMRNDSRVEVPMSQLSIGLKCGGSDAFSGITANPLLGAFSDWLVQQGGSTVLTEVPEMFGAETTLMNRAKNSSVFEKTVGLINGFKDYFRSNNQVIYENPSPGNKDGGITTLEEKSLGNVQKGGSSLVVDVLDYGEQIKEHGLNLLWSPGNDLVSSSALGMASCQMVLFTTGRGTPFGSFVPTMKIASNSALYNRKTNWMDFDAGQLIDSTSKDALLSEFIDFITEIANGKKLKHELTHSKELAIFKSGVTL